MLLSSYTFLFSQILFAQSNFHPALIMKKLTPDSFTSEEVYISFVGCGSENKSVIDQLPLMKSTLSDVLHRIENLAKELRQLQGLAKELAMTQLQLSGQAKAVENVTTEVTRMEESPLNKSSCMPRLKISKKCIFIFFHKRKNFE